VSTIDIPDGSPFGTDNLPYGVFSTPGTAPRSGVRVGDSVVDLGAALGTDGPDAALAAPVLNPFMAQGRARWVEVRERITAMVPVTSRTRRCTRSAMSPCTCRSRSATTWNRLVRQQVGRGVKEHDGEAEQRDTSRHHPSPVLAHRPAEITTAPFSRAGVTSTRQSGDRSAPNRRRT
jgi:hypothetical protein